jgi:hypothetical protein
LLGKQSNQYELHRTGEYEYADPSGPQPMVAGLHQQQSEGHAQHTIPHHHWDGADEGLLDEVFEGHEILLQFT